MDIFDMVKAAPPPQTINPVERKLSTPSPIPPDSPLDSIDLLDGGILSNEDDLDKEANLDVSPFQIPRRKSSDNLYHNSDGSLFKMPKRMKKNDEIEELDEAVEMVSQFNDEKEAGTASRKPKKSVELDKAKKPGPPLKPHKKRPTEPELQKKADDDDDDEESEDHQLTTMPTKTKAQQKMFSDQPLDKPNFDRECVVRARRLKQQEIDSALESVANSPFADVADAPQSSRGRGRPKKNTQLPPKSRKSPPKPTPKPKPNFHIKVPLQNGAKKRASQHLARTHTPPPNLARRQVKKQAPVPQVPKAKPKPKPKPKSKTKPIRGCRASQSLIERYGARFFNSVVRVKRLHCAPSGHKGPACSARPIGGTKKGRPPKANKSVSFSEAVEILGSSEGSSRRATFGSISSKSPKPTRLQRVDATGNVLEDIALTSTPLLPPIAAGSSSSAPGGLRGKGKRRSCNGSPSPMAKRLKRSHQRLPLSSLASLRLDDGPKAGEDDDEDDDEEYIVPNELPGIQRPGTPPPKKKRITFTTTISDDEDEKPFVKKQKDIPKKPPKPLKESFNKKPDKSLKEKEKADKTLKEKERTKKKSNEIVKKELSIVTAEVVDAATNKVEIKVTSEEENKPMKEEIQSQTEENDLDAAESNEVERDGEAPAPDATEENPDLSGEPGENVEDTPVGNAGDKSGETAEETEEKAEQEDSGENLYEETALETSDDFNASAQKPAEQEEQIEEVGKAEEVGGELATPPPQLPSTDTTTNSTTTNSTTTNTTTTNSTTTNTTNITTTTTNTTNTTTTTTEDNQDDVLEIQTSLDDVRQLHTPSSRQSTPKQRSRLDSGDSDCSFKSASDHGKPHAAAGAAPAEEEEEGAKPAAVSVGAEEEQPADAIVADDALDPGELPAELMTTPPSATRTVNGSNPTSGSSISTPFYSPIEPMPTLDDEVLGQLVEPDFQLNSSRHAISRGTLDDIMTALES
ncbi:nucleolar and coiled-body phosphoprotein 1 isoform X1 [Drosophila gunungcola]|uniref:nucleolar and coiled-body phosphoprotein 1 isoform X1 n=1 Tax=Drosophila gunungcola TaxID=103775 RepID=UPI0022E22DAF|nr:nucleolar and coiled-body phosphoprotein 1 isoform X1 [Drosophila gunungcola]